MALGPRKTNLTKEEAEIVAVAGLSYLAAEPERIGRFLAITGLGPENIRAASRDSSFFPALLDYLLANETELIAFAGEMNLDPARVRAARELLGPPLPN